jgi:hypothetical protein
MMVVMPVKIVTLLAGPAAARAGALTGTLTRQMGTFVNEKVWMYRGERTGKF